MAIKSKFQAKHTNGRYEVFHFETDANQVITNSNRLFVSQSDKSNWDAKETTTGAQAKADSAKNSAISTAKSYTDSALSGKANANHTHTEYASSSHTHSGYASSSHNHDGSYLSKNGGTVNGAITGNANAGEMQFKATGNNLDAGFYLNQDGRIGMYDWKNNRGIFQYNSSNGITSFDTTCTFYGRLRADGGIYMGDQDRIGKSGSLYLFDIDGHWKNSELYAGRVRIEPWSTEGTALYINHDGERTNGRTDLTLVPSRSNYGIFGRSSRYWYIAWSTAWRTPSYRKSKYDIRKTSDELLYGYLKDINIYNYRRISGNEEDVKEAYDYRGDLQMGAMIDELPFEVVDHDTEHGEGKGIDLYGYASMIAGACKHTIKKVETNESTIEDLQNKIKELEEKLNGITNG